MEPAAAGAGLPEPCEPTQATPVAQVNASDCEGSSEPHLLKHGGGIAALSTEARAQLAEIRARLEVRVGQIVLMLMNVPRYRHQTLADLNHLIIEPLICDRVAIAHEKTDEAGDAPTPPPAGIAIWASVDDKTDAKIKEQVKAGTFPIRLSAEEWGSGDSIWLLDVIANTRDLANKVLVNFGRIAGVQNVQLHPIVAKSVDPKLLEELRAPRVANTESGLRSCEGGLV